MALSKEDLLAISQLLDEKLDEKLDAKFDEKLDAKFDEKFALHLQPIKEEIRDMKAEMSDMKGDIKNIKTDITNIKADISNMQADISKLQSDVISIKLRQENVIEPQLRLLAENYVPAAKRFMKASDQIEEMQEDIAVLKKVVADHSEKLSKIS